MLSPNTMHAKAHGFSQPIEQNVNIVMNVRNPFINIIGWDCWVIILPHWPSQLHEDGILPPILKDGNGSSDVSNTRLADEENNFKLLTIRNFTIRQFACSSE